ncbi:MAG: N-formylglutamate amidohydrolase [Paracoccus sp. (in: a-proteobacteria)]|jgi:predicted N-formylglutamate amidohydrolase|uniref:N-formylglutamate amidohydrolase n=1 Tax=unclassified Paracoccus (in: a-proteobacteria) TaxID=2688777 RepID=UPI000C4AF69E|nr:MULTISPECIES: N-formylglutamate amidohydrolase [unclassified Paracoccus (in: a-proteobacteria)]MAN55830.1 N-formylglutamate amidohydrolase [Paracoccus sp. (in: a-proteobacteria)]MBA49893.1 N-formylglutamate amidohydrolase [Paracoccus sp. (in: a-proteobacteria)]MCS5602642.1 N-formylglutamate amidohydrolase [Paracoccus sp. (in: a-proteobacteria)]MDB2490472.1 N-formylglutamate amidohydrolase [Paracoccus sp. (in: a-proteobacteria)]MDB2551059.1 N-formylglutamate amidohydrolase [Paracoccus sp. (i|tara:strand:- start:11278 stop:12036 length:759 start_codon:yes stop_codon:yes gene_type:complete
MKDDHSTTERAFWTLGEDRPSRWLITCDHATNRVPRWVGGGELGIADADMGRHIAYDVGAAGVAERLAALMDAPAILSDFSRLVIDPNRGEDDPTLLMRLYDGTVIPANKSADAAERRRRLERLHRPYHAALARLAARHPARCLCAVHSFTPQLRGRPPRPWQIGILYSHRDARLGPAMVAACRAEGWITGENQPYSGHLDGDSIDRHALSHGRPNMLIEIRNDLIRTEQGQAEWAGRLAPVIARVLDETGL